MDLDTLEFIREAGRVRRFHCFTTVLPDLVGHHTFNLLGILRYCVPESMVTPSLIWAAYDHDLPERHTGDIPAPFKRRVEGLRDACTAEEQRILRFHGIECLDLSPREAIWLKLADSLDGAYHCLEERRLGNTTLDKVFNTFRLYVRDLLRECDANDHGHFPEVLNHIVLEWRQANGPIFGE